MSDTSLILACKDFETAYQELIAAGTAEDEDAFDGTAIAVERLVERIAASAPTTLSGIRAKARAAVVLWAGVGSDISSGDETTALARSLLIDLAGLPDDASVVRFDPVRQTVGIRNQKDWR